MENILTGVRMVPEFEGGPLQLVYNAGTVVTPDKVNLRSLFGLMYRK